MNIVKLIALAGLCGLTNLALATNGIAVQEVLPPVRCVELPNGNVVPVERFNQVYAGIEQIFGDDNTCGRTVNLRFVIEMCIGGSGRPGHLGWSEKRWAFMNKEMLYDIAQAEGTFAMKPGKDFLNHIYRLTMHINGKIVEKYWYCFPTSGGWYYYPGMVARQQRELYDQLCDFDIVRKLESNSEHSKTIEVIDAEIIAILNAIVIKKTPESVPCLKNRDDFRTVTLE